MCWFWPILTNAQTTLSPPNGAHTSTVAIAGQPITCSSNGAPITWIANYALHDVGHTQISPAGATIQYDPAILNQMPDHLKMFWLGHECAHAYIPTMNESLADCWSATQGVLQGWFGPGDADNLAQVMASNPGDFSHPPGPARVAHVRACMAAAAPHTTTPGTIATPTNATSAALLSDTPFDILVSRLVALAPSNFDAIKGPSHRVPHVNATFYPWKSTNVDLLKCSIQVSDDSSNHPSISCDGYSDNDKDDAAALAEYSIFGNALKKYAKASGTKITESTNHDADANAGLTTDTTEMETVATNLSTVRILYETQRYTVTDVISRSVDLWVDAP